MTLRDRHRHSSFDASAGVRPPDSDVPGRGPPDKSQRALASGGFFPRRKYSLEGGHAYMVFERKPDRALSFTKQAVKGGFQPVIVSGPHPGHPSFGAPSNRIWLPITLGGALAPPQNLRGPWKGPAHSLQINNRGRSFL